MKLISQPSLGDCYLAVADALLAHIGKPQHHRHAAYLQAWMRRHRSEVRNARGAKAAASECHIALTGRVVGMLS